MRGRGGAGRGREGREVAKTKWTLLDKRVEGVFKGRDWSIDGLEITGVGVETSPQIYYPVRRSPQNRL